MARDLARHDTGPFFVIVGEKVYRDGVVYAAMHTVFLERLEQLVPEGASPRTVLRAVRQLKSPGEHQAIMEEAVRRVLASGEEVPLKQALEEGGGPPIAAFPVGVGSYVDK